jgi:putative hydrolase of HD superfamily
MLKLQKNMKKIANFLIEVEKLKGKKRRGWQIHKIKNAETAGEHIFHLALLVWLLGRKKKINLERALKIALTHDLCELYSPDFTSYDAAALKEKGRISLNDFLKLQPKPGRPTNTQRKKMEKIKQSLEKKAMKKICSQLPSELKREMTNLWLDYENGRTKEGRFVKQADKATNLLQGLIYWKKYGKIQHYLWVRRAKEILDDPVVLEFVRILENKFCRKCRH